MNPRPDNQRVPHDHCYAFATRILTGGYVHVVRRRTDSWSGPFRGADLAPGIVTVERPGSAYAIGDSMVHQAVMEPDTVTLFVRGPRRKKLSHAAEELMPPPENWPEPAIPADPREESWACTLTEYQSMRTYLARHNLIGWPLPLRVGLSAANTHDSLALKPMLSTSTWDTNCTRGIPGRSACMRSRPTTSLTCDDD